MRMGEKLQGDILVSVKDKYGNEIKKVGVLCKTCLTCSNSIQNDNIISVKMEACITGNKLRDFFIY